MITPHHILSAAHCFKTVSLVPDDFEFWVGKFKKEADEAGFAQRLFAEEIKLHPDYERAGKHDSDLAIIRLRSPGASLTSQVSTICLPPDASYHPADGARCYVTGYGATKGTGFDDELKQATLPIISQAECGTMEPRLKVRFLSIFSKCFTLNC